MWSEAVARRRGAREAVAALAAVAVLLAPLAVYAAIVFYRFDYLRPVFGVPLDAIALIVKAFGIGHIWMAAPLAQIDLTRDGGVSAIFRLTPNEGTAALALAIAVFASVRRHLWTSRRITALVLLGAAGGILGAVTSVADCCGQEFLFGTLGTLGWDAALPQALQIAGLPLQYGAAVLLFADNLHRRADVSFA
jgi:hypothetical protein